MRWAGSWQPFAVTPCMVALRPCLCPPCGMVTARLRKAVLLMDVPSGKKPVDMAHIPLNRVFSSKPNPTDAGFCPSNISFMDHFSDSCENVRSTFCPVGLRCWQKSQVFEEFTVFASDYVAFIHACDRCRFLNWKWVECTYGIMDQDREVGTHFNGTARKTKEWTEGKDNMDLKIPPVGMRLAKTHKLWLGSCSQKYQISSNPRIFEVKMWPGLCTIARGSTLDWVSGLTFSSISVHI